MLTVTRRLLAATIYGACFLFVFYKTNFIITKFFYCVDKKNATSTTGFFFGVAALSLALSWTPPADEITSGISCSAMIKSLQIHRSIGCFALFCLLALVFKFTAPIFIWIFFAPDKAPLYL